MASTKSVQLLKNINNQQFPPISDQQHDLYAQYDRGYSKKQTPEDNCVRALWRSVITQALMDAASNSQKRSKRINKVKALRWLQGNDEEFTIVCQLADLEPNYVRLKAAAAIARGCKWRNDSRLELSICRDNHHLELMEQEIEAEKRAATKIKVFRAKQRLSRASKQRIPDNENVNPATSTGEIKQQHMQSKVCYKRYKQHEQHEQQRIYHIFSEIWRSVMIDRMSSAVVANINSAPLSDKQLFLGHHRRLKRPAAANIG